MSNPQQFDHFIDNIQQGESVTPTDNHEAFTHDLVQLAHQFELSSDFDEAMLAQLQPETPTSQGISRRWLRLTASILLGVVGLSLLILTVPPLRVIAGELFSELFRRDDETTRIFEGKEGHYAFGGETISLTSIEDIQYVIDYDVKFPDHQQLGYDFERANIVPVRNTIQVYYSQPLETRDTTFYKLQVRQQPLADSVNGIFYFTDEQDTISPEAETTPVSIAGNQGELVQGDWFTSSMSTTKYFFWKSDAPVYRVRWQDDNFLYEVELWSMEDNVIEEIIAIAESMMTPE